MCENNLTSIHTPLKSSKAAKKPFRSPLIKTSLAQNVNKESPLTTKSKTHSLESKSLPKKRILSSPDSPVDKKQRLNEKCIKDNNNECILFKRDLEALKARIEDKRNRIADLKTKSFHSKHKKEDLEAEIVKWKTVCQEVLERFYNDTKERQGPSLTMAQVLSMLGIPGDVVNFSIEDDWFI